MKFTLVLLSVLLIAKARALNPNGLTFQRVGDRDVDNDDGVLDADYLPDFEDDSEPEVEVVPAVAEQVPSEQSEEPFLVAEEDKTPVVVPVAKPNLRTKNVKKYVAGAVIGAAALTALGLGLGLGLRRNDVGGAVAAPVIPATETATATSAATVSGPTVSEFNTLTTGSIGTTVVDGAQTNVGIQGVNTESVVASQISESGSSQGVQSSGSQQNQGSQAGPTSVAVLPKSLSPGTKTFFTTEAGKTPVYVAARR